MVFWLDNGLESKDSRQIKFSDEDCGARNKKELWLGVVRALQRPGKVDFTKYSDPSNWYSDPSTPMHLVFLGLNIRAECDAVKFKVLLTRYLRE